MTTCNLIKFAGDPKLGRNVDLLEGRMAFPGSSLPSEVAESPSLEVLNRCGLEIGLHMTSGWLDSMILKVSSKLDDSMINYSPRNLWSLHCPHSLEPAVPPH